MPGAAGELQLESFLDSWRKRGLFTHAFVATGQLAKPEPNVLATLLPDHRDVFDLASLTKALVTTPAVLKLVAEGQWLLDEPLATAPVVVGNPGWFAGVPSRLFEFTPRALLRHESGLPAWRNFYVQCQRDDGSFEKQPVFENLDGAAAAISGQPTNRYSDIGFLVLGVFLERTYRANLTDIFKIICGDFNYLSPASQHLGFAPDFNEETRRERCIPTGWCPVRQRDLVGEVYDENAWSLGGRCAHAGLFGSGRALVTFLRAMHFSAAGRRMLDLQAAELGDLKNESLLGWRQGNDPAARPFGGGAAMGHLGFTGTAFWVTSASAAEHPDHYAVVLTNRTCSGRVNPLIREFRREILDILWRAL
ncbi:MAG: hypothetical protein RIQ81_430 [Pseudomonadota bacterium]|jgi:CubicO group peptidase (beta-lactamase class C family)